MDFLHNRWLTRHICVSLTTCVLKWRWTKVPRWRLAWLNILQNEKMLLTSSRTVNSVSRVRADLHTLAQMKSSSRNHTENIPSHLKIDEKAAQDRDSCIIEFDWEPWYLVLSPWVTWYMVLEVPTKMAKQELLRSSENVCVQRTRQLVLLFTDVEGTLSAKHLQLGIQSQAKWQRQMPWRTKQQHW